MRQYLKLQFKKHAHRLSLSGRQQRKPFVESTCVEMKPNILREFAMEIGDQVSWQMEPHAFGIKVREACRRAVKYIDRDLRPIVLLVSFTSGGSHLRPA